MNGSLKAGSGELGERKHSQGAHVELHGDDRHQGIDVWQETSEQDVKSICAGKKGN